MYLEYRAHSQAPDPLLGERVDEEERHLCRVPPYLPCAVGHSRVKRQVGTSQDQDPVPARTSTYMTAVTEG